MTHPIPDREEIINRRDAFAEFLFWRDTAKPDTESRTKLRNDVLTYLYDEQDFSPDREVRKDNDDDFIVVYDASRTARHAYNDDAAWAPPETHQSDGATPSEEDFTDVGGMGG